MNLLYIFTFLASKEICVTGQRSTDNKTERRLIHLDYKHINEPGSVMPVVQLCTCSVYIFNVLTIFFSFFFKTHTDFDLADSIFQVFYIILTDTLYLLNCCVVSSH